MGGALLAPYYLKTPAEFRGAKAIEIQLEAGLAFTACLPQGTFLYLNHGLLRLPIYYIKQGMQSCLYKSQLLFTGLPGIHRAAGWDIRRDGTGQCKSFHSLLKCEAAGSGSRRAASSFGFLGYIIDPGFQIDQSTYYIRSSTRLVLFSCLSFDFPVAAMIAISCEQVLLTKLAG